MAWLKAAALITLAFFAPIKTLLCAAIVLIVCDAITGMIASHKRGERLTSAGARRTVSKLLVYQGAIIVGFLIELMMSGAMPIARMVAGCIAVVEGKSALENLDSINGSSLFKTIIEKIGSKNDRP